MIVNLYCIFDDKAKMYNKPFAFVNDQVATRAAMDILTDGDSEIRNYPTDFSMFKLGTYDDTTAQIDYNMELLLRFNELTVPTTIITEEIKEENS